MFLDYLGDLWWNTPKWLSSSLQIKIYWFGNNLVLNRRGPRPPGHTFLKPEKHETLSYHINGKWGAAWDFFFFFYIIATNSNDVWNENSLSSSQRRKTLLRSVCGDRDAQFQAWGDSQENLPHPAGSQRFSNKHSRRLKFFKFPYCFQCSSP